MKRESIENGATRLTTDGCSFTYWKFRPGVLLMQIAGDDMGLFGTATQDEAERAFRRFGGPLELYVEATEAIPPATTVMEDWIAWFAVNRQRLKRVLMLIRPEDKVLHLTIEITRHLSRTGNLIEVCLDSEKFWSRLERAAPGAARQFNSASA